MKEYKIDLSIVIVRYEVVQDLFNLLDSLYKTIQKNISYEIIVVDNNTKHRIKNELSHKYPKVRYVPNVNNGFGAAINTGVGHAHGEYILGLNPDLIIHKDCVSILLNFLKKNPQVGLVSPQYLLEDGSQPELQVGTRRLTPVVGVMALSFMAKLFPKNKVYKNFYKTQRNRKKDIEVDAVPGGAFMIRKSLFEEVGGFDKKFFLYFEEHDLSNRVKDLGYKNYILPEASVYHVGGIDSENLRTTDTFKKSRFYYFKKHYGVLPAYIVQMFTEFQKTTAVIVGILALSLFLRVYNLSSLMQFIPDQGWFYLSARDMLLTGNIPLVGLPTSHPWIHHGPLWTYTLAFLLFVSNFNPIFPAYCIAFLGVFVVWLFYMTASRMFSKDVGIVSSLLFATSPLVVMNSRIPYHTSPIPFFVILLVFLTYMWVKGKTWVFPFIALLLAILYNHEITTFVFDIAIILVLLYGIFKKKTYAVKLWNKRIIILSIILFLLPMIPFILYDTTHGYKQTFGFIVWVGYRVVKLPLSLIDKSYVSSGSSASTIPEFLSHYQELVFVGSGLVSNSILITSFLGFLFVLLKKRSAEYYLLLLFFVVSSVGLFIHRVPIEADTLLIAPFFILFIAITVSFFLQKKILKYPVAIFIGVIVIGNIWIMLSTGYFSNSRTYFRMPYYKRMDAVQEVIKEANGQKYNLVAKGTLSNFPVFLTPYEYLLWYNKNAPSKQRQAIVIQIWEKGNGIIVSRIK